ncbi:GntR family transcriptional regulator [Martelella radicis]|uniref:GntR family transcriptional regulator n=1 Tax=Martelella radicis TaxID=1397476 RepID=A0A7W6KM40_9HYPH|nr:GntR family transcriptional regulator [Martelella radicis]MBB4123707.1 GntR family transcriptional regulator [Martelella radicis]
MTDTQVQFDQAMDRIVDAIDRSSSVAVSVQLRGALEFGIASGELPAGGRMPSVRSLASRLGISPVTVSTVYAALQEVGHTEGRVGSGTFVKSISVPANQVRLRELDMRIAELVELGRDCGISPAELATRVSMSSSRPNMNMRLLIVGNFVEATEAYAAALRPHLAHGDTLSVATMDMLENVAPDSVDLVISPRSLLKPARDHFADTPITGVTLIPDEATRVSLASLATDAEVVGYSYFDTFVTLMKAGIRRFGPHITELKMVVRGEPGVEEAIASADVLVYATGAEYLLETLRSDQRAFEYRHTPDIHSVRKELLPTIEAYRTKILKKRRGNVENFRKQLG